MPRLSSRLCSLLDHVDDRAVRRASAGTLLDCRGEQALKPGKVNNLGADHLQMVSGDRPYFGAARTARTAKLNEGADLARREAKLASPADKAKRADMAFVIESMAALGPRRLDKDSYLLKIADGFRINAGTARKLAAPYPTNRQLAGRRHEFP